MADILKFNTLRDKLNKALGTSDPKLPLCPLCVFELKKVDTVLIQLAHNYNRGFSDLVVCDMHVRYHQRALNLLANDRDLSKLEEESFDARYDGGITMLQLIHQECSICRSEK